MISRKRNLRGVSLHIKNLPIGLLVWIAELFTLTKFIRIIRPVSSVMDRTGRTMFDTCVTVCYN